MSQPRELASIILPSSKISIKRWEATQRNFINTDTEAHCYDNPDMMEECEFTVKVDVPPLSYSMVQLYADDKNSTLAIADNGWKMPTEDEMR
jgi:hypothetical protein